jgi:hypothetical protein
LDEASWRRRCAMEYRREKFSRTMGKLLAGAPIAPHEANRKEKFAP